MPSIAVPQYRRCYNLLPFTTSDQIALTDSPQVSSTPSEHASGDRLDSWKEIAAHMRRDVKTVQRWEKREGMPVHRHLHDKMGSVYAFRTELDRWGQIRKLSATAEEPSP